MYDDRITTTAEYGAHVALTCRNHPGKRWSTKNIAPLGCRSIFYNLMDEPGMGPECSCSGRDLIPVDSDEGRALLARYAEQTDSDVTGYMARWPMGEPAEG